MLFCPKEISTQTPHLSLNHGFIHNAPAISLKHTALFIRHFRAIFPFGLAGHPIFASCSKLLQVVTVRVDRTPHPPSPGISTKRPLWRWRNASTHKTLCSRKFTYFESISRVVTEQDQPPHSRSSPWRIFYAHLVTQCHGNFTHDVCLFVCGIPENKIQRSPDDVPNFMYDTRYRAHLTIHTRSKPEFADIFIDQLPHECIDLP